MFHPYKTTQIEWNAICEKYIHNIIPIEFKTNDNLKLCGALVNTTKTPNWSDTIFLYSHGNAGWIGGLVISDRIKLLSNHGSIFMYDYRNYGCSDKLDKNNTYMEKGLYIDAHSAYDYLTKIQNINPDKIIVYGHSLGSAISSKLVSNLVKDNIKVKGLILEAPFTKISDIAGEKFPVLSYFCIYDFNNIENIKNISTYVNICIVHSKSDEIISYKYSNKLINHNNNCKYIIINGSHNYPIFNTDIDTWISELCKK